MKDGLNRRKWYTDFLYILPTILFIFSISLVRLHQFSMPMTNVYWSEAVDTSTLSDLFTFWKAVAIVIAACLAIPILIIGYFGNSVHIKKSVFYIPLIIYLCCVFVSLFFSDYKYFALYGMSEHFEGSFILLSYIIMLFFTANVIDRERRLKFIIYSAFLIAFLLGVLGFTQAAGHDFLSTSAGQKLITPNYTLDNGMKSWDMIDVLAASGQKLYSFAFEQGEVYQTVYNINYVPLYLSLLIPICAVLFIYFGINASGKKRVVPIIFLILFFIFVYNFFAASSASGYLGLLLIFVSAIFIFRKHLKTCARLIICLILIVCLIMGLLSNQWLTQVKDLWGSVKNFAFSYIFAEDSLVDNLSFEHNAGVEWALVDYIETNEDSIDFSVGGNSLVIFRDDANGAYIFTDADGEQLYLRQLENEEGSFEIMDERFHDYVKVSLVKSNEKTFLKLDTRANEWLFYHGDNGFLHYNKTGKFVPLTKIEHSSFIKDYRFGSNRGLIWDTTIPLLKSYIFKGAGADAFTFAYPQRDYATLYNVFWGEQMTLVTDKAHNLYMQYWVNTGLISLLAWLMMVGYYLVGAVKQFRKRGFVDFCDFVNGGIFCGIIGFLAVAFFNDGSVNTMPMFYTMLGTGLAINMRDKWPGSAAESNKDNNKQLTMPEV